MTIFSLNSFSANLWENSGYESEDIFLDEGKLVLKTKGYHHVTRFSEDDVNLDAVFFVFFFGAPPGWLNVYL